MPITRLELEKWLDAYFAAWRSNEAAEVEALFAPDAVYSYGPFREPARGREQIVANWVADGAPLSAEFRYEILAVHGDTGIAHWNVRQKAYYFHEPTLELDGILVLRFDADGRCVEHLEWFDRRYLEDGTSPPEAVIWPRGNWPLYPPGDCFSITSMRCMKLRTAAGAWRMSSRASN